MTNILQPDILKQNLTFWKDIHASNTILSWLDEGITIPFHSFPPETDLTNSKLSQQQSDFIDTELAKLYSIGAIEKCSKKPYFISPIGAVPKKKNKWRLITDLRQLNTFSTPPKFSNEGIKVAQQLVTAGDHLITIDLKDGFFHVPVNVKHRTFLGFRWKNQYYRWAVLPFGLNASPYFFTKILRPVISYLRENSYKVIVYVDDFLLSATPQCINEQKHILINTLTQLGFQINFEKSSLEPSTSKKWLGFLICSQGQNNIPEIKIPHERIHRLRKDIRRTLSKGTSTARFLARVAGQCVAMAEAIIPAKLLLRNVYRLLATRHSWDATLILDASTIADLQWWLDALRNWNGRPIVKHSIELQLTTDASSTGWGAWINNHQAAGFWNKRLATQPSNYREMIAVLMGLHSFHEMVRGKVVQIVSDNISTVAYINNLGGPSSQLTDAARAIWSFAYDNKITLTATFLAGRDNTHADSLSRINPQYEWQLHPHLFDWLDRVWGPHTIDRFATMTTSQLDRYNSRYYDPLTEGVDALAQQNWAHENNYVNAPFRLLPRILDVIDKQRANATIIAPWWPSQPWFNRLKSRTIRQPIKLPTNQRTIWSSGHTPEPLKNKKWKLYAWRISGVND